MSFTKSFIGGAVGGAAVTAAANVGFSRIWNWLCVIFLPGWLIVFSIGIPGIGAADTITGGAAGYRTWGWISLILSVFFLYFLTMAAAKITAPSLVTVPVATGAIFGYLRYGSWGRRIAFALPAIFLILTPFLSAFAAIAGAASAIVIGVISANAIKQEYIAAEQLAVRLGSALGGELLPGSLFYGAEPGTFGISPLPPQALTLVSNIDELRPRIDSFAPEWEVRFLDTQTLIVGPRGHAAQATPDAPLAAAE